MDDYGIGSAASMALHLYECASRGTGRTSRMIEAARDDDLIVCRTGKSAELARMAIKAAGKSTRVVAVAHADELHARIAQRPRGRLLFDHDWVHQFFVDAMKSAEDDLRRLADSLSSTPSDRAMERENAMNRQRRGGFPA